MKRLFKTSIVVLMTLCSISTLNAQRMDVGVHLIPSIPLGDYATGLDFGFGGQIFGDYYFTDNISAGLEIGLVSHSGSQTIPTGFFGSQTIDFTSNIIPIQATGEWHLDPSEELDFFAGTGAGIFMIGGDFPSSTEVGISPRVGASYEVADEIRLNGQLVYTSIFNSGNSISYLNIALGATYMLFD